GEALYPFGHGLSYTSFRYDGLQLAKGKLTAGTDQTVRLICRVTNIGEVAGEEVVQLYGRANQSRVKRPRKQLLGFRRVMLQPGETADVSFEVPLDQLAIWDVTRERYCIETGTYMMMAGASSENLPLTAELVVDGETIPPRDLTQLTKAINYDDYEGVLIAADAVVEVRLDHPEGLPAGRITLTSGDPQKWQDYTCKLSGIHGSQNVIPDSMLNHVISYHNFPTKMLTRLRTGFIG
ncbi:hypothetical protein BGX30_002663, partial [Mortierella sp. GBA39]